MKRSEKPIKLGQLPLPLLNAPKAAISDEKQRELALVLVELLISAAQENEEAKTNGGDDEPEAHR